MATASGRSASSTDDGSTRNAAEASANPSTIQPGNRRPPCAVRITALPAILASSNSADLGPPAGFSESGGGKNTQGPALVGNIRDGSPFDH